MTRFTQRVLGNSLAKDQPPDLLRKAHLTAKVIGTPGHGAGDLTFEIDGSLYCGDLLFHGSVGRTDFPGGDFRALLTSVAKLTARYPASTAVYPGHMDPTTLGEELAFNPFLRTLDSND